MLFSFQDRNKAKRRQGGVYTQILLKLGHYFAKQHFI
jgi:hypothetical protein